MATIKDYTVKEYIRACNDYLEAKDAFDLLSITGRAALEAWKLETYDTPSFHAKHQALQDAEENEKAARDDLERARLFRDCVKRFVELNMAYQAFASLDVGKLAGKKWRYKRVLDAFKPEDFPKSGENGVFRAYCCGNKEIHLTFACGDYSLDTLRYSRYVFGDFDPAVEADFVREVIESLDIQQLPSYDELLELSYQIVTAKKDLSVLETRFREEKAGIIDKFSMFDVKW